MASLKPSFPIEFGKITRLCRFCQIAFSLRTSATDVNNGSRGTSSYFMKLCCSQTLFLLTHIPSNDTAEGCFGEAGRDGDDALIRQTVVILEVIYFD